MVVLDVEVVGIAGGDALHDLANLLAAFLDEQVDVVGMEGIAIDCAALALVEVGEDFGVNGVVFLIGDKFEA